MPGLKFDGARLVLYDNRTEPGFPSFRDHRRVRDGTAIAVLFAGIALMTYILGVPAFANPTSWNLSVYAASIAFPVLLIVGGILYDLNALKIQLTQAGVRIGRRNVPIVRLRCGVIHETNHTIVVRTTSETGSRPIVGVNKDDLVNPQAFRNALDAIIRSANHDSA